MPFTALVVEDSATMRQLLTYALSKIPEVTTIEVPNGLEALKYLAEKDPPDIILSDINMPVMDGLKLVQRIRAEEKLVAVPIVMVTTEASEEDRDRAFVLGANAYISKPIVAARLVKEIKSLLNIDD
ncbi:MAG TPA: response regulator [Kofleriaceae bacterium]|nr:response regulator [Kofleriaceae bacterium]